MGPREGEIDEEEEEDWEIKVFRMAAPLATKRSDEVLGVVMEFVLRLRADGYWVSQVHTDLGHEYYGPLKNGASRGTSSSLGRQVMTRRETEERRWPFKESPNR